MKGLQLGKILNLRIPGEKRVIGRREKVEFPDLGLKGIRAKVDSGAYTSSIHCTNVSLTEVDGAEMLCFDLLDPHQQEYHRKSFYYPIYKKKLIKNSFGQVEERYVIQTKIRLFDEDFITEFTLADRSAMEYPVLLGRKLLRNQFVVDVSKVNLSRKSRTSKKS